MIKCEQVIVMKIMKKIFILFGFILVLLIFLELIPIAPKYDNENPWIQEEGARPLIIPHGGAKAMYPENTIFAFESIDALGYDVFEVDLALTADDILITHHDINTKETSGVDVDIRDVTYDKLIKDDQGKYIQYINSYTGEDLATYQNASVEVQEKLIPATLEYLFKTYPNKLYILELKDTEDNSGPETFKYAVDILLNLIEEHKMKDQVIISSFDDQVTDLIKKNSDHSIMTSTASSESLKFVMLNLLRVDFFYKPSDGALILPIQDPIRGKQLDLVKKLPAPLRNEIAVYDKENDIYYTNIAKKSMVEEAHRHNMAIIYWTVNDEAEMRRLVKMGVDGIITDHPDVLKAILDETYE